MPSANVEAAEALRLLLADVHVVDVGAARPFAQEVDEALDGVGLALGDDLDRPVRTIGGPAGDAQRLRAPPRRVTEEHALHAPADDDAAPDRHGAQPTRLRPPPRPGS